MMFIAGCNDATIILKERCGSRRLQDMNGLMDEHYTIIIGSHRNSCVKIERNGELKYVERYRKEDVKLTPVRFTSFWIHLDMAKGKISVGWGRYLRDENTYCVWKDDDPLQGLSYVGLSSWDSHIGYRRVRVFDVPALHGESHLGGAGETLQFPIWDGAPDVDCTFDESDESVRIGQGKEEFSSAELLSSICIVVLEHNLNWKNACQTLMVSDALCGNESALREEAIQIISEHIVEISEQCIQQFRRLSSELMVSVVKSQAIACSEKELYDAVLLWAGGSGAFASAGPSTPQKHTTRRQWCNNNGDAILHHIRYPLMNMAELRAIMETSLYHRSHVLKDLVQEAVQIHQQPGHVWKSPSIRVKGIVRDGIPRLDAAIRCQPRCPRGCTPLVYMYDGDTNGVCHFIGTRYGSQPWVNPVSAGPISVRASSPPSRCGTDPKALVSRNFCRVNFAGSRRTLDGQLESWWMIDLGKCHRLRCTRYIVRHDESADYLRSWQLQGSLDGEEWHILSQHAADNTLTMPGQYASWPIKLLQPPAYRYFRIFQTEPNLNAPNPRHVSLSYLDFYGDFYVI